MEPASPFAALAGHKYLNLETFRKNGQGVRTPVWFAEDPPSGSPQKLYVYSAANSGKAKRIRNNRRVRMAPCDARGKLRGDWVEGHAEIITGAETERAARLLDRKYVPWRQLLNFFAMFSRNKRIAFAIHPA
jgi:uncharacterized protein